MTRDKQRSSRVEGTLLPQALPFASHGEAGDHRYEGASVFGDGDGDGAGAGAHSSVISA